MTAGQSVRKGPGDDIGRLDSEQPGKQKSLEFICLLQHLFKTISLWHA